MIKQAHKIPAQPCAAIFVILRNPVSLAAVLRAHDYITAAIHFR